MKTLILTGLAVIAVVLTAPVSATAETVLRTSESISLAVDQQVNGDFYGVAYSGPISLSGTILGDAFVIGTSVTANGSIAEDLFAIGGTTQIHASVTDDVRVVAGEVTIAEEVGGDVFVVGGVLTVLSSANIEGNIFFYGGEAEINGRIGGSVFGTSESLRIDGPVVGNVNVDVGRGLVIGERADIGGDISYTSEREIIRAQNAVVVGDIIRNSVETATPNAREALVPLLMYTFTVLVLFALFKNRLNRFMKSSLESFTRNGLIGIAGFFAAPLVLVLLFVTVIGVVIGVMGLFSLIVMFLLSFVFSAIFLGAILQKVITKQTSISLLWVLVGAVGIQAMMFIPIIGPLLLLAIMAVMFGTMLVALYQVIFQ